MATKALSQAKATDIDASATGQVISLDPGLLIAKAIEHAVPVETLERLLAMRTALVEESARTAFFAALAEFQARIGPIPKRQCATVQGKAGSRFQYHYANLGDIVSAVGPALADLGLSVTFDTSLSDRALTVTAKVNHAAGHTEESTFAVPLATEARMSPAQAMGSALTYARRYAMCAALGIVTAEDDDDGQSSDPPPRSATPAPDVTPPVPETISAAQHRLLEARIGELGLDRERVKAWTGRAWAVHHLNEIPASQFQSLLDRLDNWAQDAREAAEERAAIQNASA